MIEDMEEIIEEIGFTFDDKHVQIGIKKHQYFGNVVFEKINYNDDRTNVSRWAHVKDPYQTFKDMRLEYNQKFDMHYYGGIQPQHRK